MTLGIVTWAIGVYMMAWASGITFRPASKPKKDQNVSVECTEHNKIVSPDEMVRNGETTTDDSSIRPGEGGSEWQK